MVWCSDPCREKIYFLQQKDQMQARSHPALHLRGNGVPFQVYSSRGIMITTHVHLILRLQCGYTFTPPSRLHYVVLPAHYRLDGLGIEFQCGH
jgi:hypothetical protein